MEREREREWGRERQLCAPLFNIVLKVLANAIKQEKAIRIKKVILVINNKIIYHNKNWKESMKHCYKQ